MKMQVRNVYHHPYLPTSMKYFYTVFLLFSVLAFTAIGCDSSDSSSTDDSESTSTLIPLDAGNTWTLRVDGGFIDQIKIEVNGTTTLNGDSYREIDILASSSESTFRRTYVARETSNGLYIARPDTSDAGIQLYGFLLQSAVSDGGSYVHTDERGNSYDVSVSAQTITVPAGSFEALVYRATRQETGNTDNAFIDPGIGPVQLDYRGEIYRLESTNVE